jgi:DNA-binding CsgD family transcriptional regulator
MACWLGTDSVDFRGQTAVARGWLARARRLLEGHTDSVEYGWLLMHEAEKLMQAGDTAAAVDRGTQALELARRVGDLDLESLAVATVGLARVFAGDVDEGSRALEEAATAALADELDQPWAAGWCCCYLIYACEQARDYDRAAQWCRRIEAWAERRLRALAYTCRAHYASVLVWRGAWEAAEAHLTESAAALAEVRPPAAVDASARLGELRRRQGRAEEALRLFERAPDHPISILGTGELHLEKGESRAARDRAEEYLRDAASRPVIPRSAGLELLVRAAALEGDVAAASTALDELTTITAQVGTDHSLASLAWARGFLAEAVGDLDRARISFEDATRLFHRTAAPWEEAQALLALARVLDRVGRSQDGAEYRTRAAALLANVGAPPSRRSAVASTPTLTAREREVLTLIARGLTNREVARKLVLSEHTVNRHVTNLLTKLGTGSRSAAVAVALRNDII